MKSVKKSTCRKMGRVYRKSVRSRSGKLIRSPSCAKASKSHTRKLSSGRKIRVKKASPSRRSAARKSPRSVSRTKSRKTVRKSRSKSRSSSRKSRRSVGRPKSRRSVRRSRSKSRSSGRKSCPRGMVYRKGYKSPGKKRVAGKCVKKSVRRRRSAGRPKKN